MTLNRIFFLLPILFLAACAAAEQESELAVTPLAQPPAEEPAVMTSEPVDEATAETPEPEADPLPLPIAETPNPDDLLGLEPKVIQELLGPVSLKRWEGSVQVMQFANDHCVMDIYFYEETPGAAFEASYINARLKDGSEISTGVCLEALLPGGQWPETFSRAGQ